MSQSPDQFKHSWRSHPGPPPWVHSAMRDGWKQQRRFFFRRFAGVFVLILFMVIGGMGFLAFHLTQMIGGNGHIAIMVWIGGLGLAFLFPTTALALGIRAFRSVAMPLADIMTATDNVAGGDLSTRVPERGSGEFVRMARSFNKMMDELQRSDQQRRNLTADVAHELRTPLHIIQGNLEGILDGVYPASKEHLEATLEETRQLGRLVDDLRILSLAESGELPLKQEQVNINDLVSDVATSFSGPAENAGVALRVENSSLPSDLNVTGDAGRLDQVLSNLVANALRHTSSGGSVTLAARAHEHRVQIDVRDTGEGIAAEDLPFIFDRFWRGDRARTRSSGGSGLGLAIANQLVKAHDGQLTVQSEVGKGTTFTVELKV
ncbi:MAG: ATP-binding protein [Caldilineaceae bacterium]